MSRGRVETRIGPYGASLTQVEDHIKDERSGSTDGADICCLIEARASGLDPLVTSARAALPGDAVKGAATKMMSLLGSAIGRVRDV